MSALGTVEAIGVDAAFVTEPIQPAAPGAGRESIDIAARNGIPRDSGDDLSELIRVSLEVSLASARASVETIRSSTTLARLAHALEAVADRDGASAVATEALELCARQGAALDPLGARLALEVLFRAGEIDSAINHARQLELSSHLRLAIGAALATAGRLDDARDFVGIARTPDARAVLGFILLLEKKYQAAVPHLRSALSESPNDVNSALNLSIALWAIGSRRKSLAAALQAKIVAPGRADIGLHYLELLLAVGDFERALREVKVLLDAGVEASSRLLIVGARAELGAGRTDRAIPLLEHAVDAARSEGDPDAVAEVQSNLIRIRAAKRKTPRKEVVGQLLQLQKSNPANVAVVLNLGHVVDRASHAPILKDATNQVREKLDETKATFLDYQIALLEGDNAAAARLARRWHRLDPHEPAAAAAVLVSVGIGEEAWHEAAAVALEVATDHRYTSLGRNNAAYVLAMAGMPDRAIELLTPHASENFILKATLGLAHLAAGEIEAGMKLYRDAAGEAERFHDDSRSLMTAYQTLVIKQLRLRDASDPIKVTALSLPDYPLPDDWADRPEFLRLHAIALRHGYSWPLSA